MDAVEVRRLAASIAVCLIIGNIGSIFTFPAISGWYASLQKPAFNPPNWIFGPVWTALFILMGISLYMVWDKGLKGRESRQAVYAFAIQLVLNVAWSLLFFGLKSPLLAFIEIIVLWVSIAVTMVLFSRVSRKAALLLLPYIAWVSFAAFLNFAVWGLNPF